MYIIFRRLYLFTMSSKYVNDFDQLQYIESTDPGNRAVVPIEAMIKG